MSWISVYTGVSKFNVGLAVEIYQILNGRHISTLTQH